MSFRQSLRNFVVLALLIGGVAQAQPKPGIATLSYPLHRDRFADPARGYKWDAVPGASVYFLWVGTEPRGQDVVYTGEITATSWPMMDAPTGVPLFATLWTKIGTDWWAHDVEFSVAPSFNFSPGAINVNTVGALKWRKWPTADVKYRVTFGRTQGSSDLFESGELQYAAEMSWPDLPADLEIWARLSSFIDGEWRSSDVPFRPRFKILSPTHGDISVAEPLVIRWTPLPRNKLSEYVIGIGTHPDHDDILHQEGLQEEQYPLNFQLPRDTPIYVRIVARYNVGTARRADVVFQVRGSGRPQVAWIYPQKDFAWVDDGRPLEWTHLPLFKSFDLRISRWGRVVKEAKNIRVGRYFLPKLSPGFYKARIIGRGDGFESMDEISFVVGHTAAKPDPRWARDTALQVLQETFEMGQAHGVLQRRYPRTWTPLYEEISGLAWAANCLNFSTVLVNTLKEMNIEARLDGGKLAATNVAFMNNGWDGHTLVELKDPVTQTVMMLDPLFGVTVKRKDGSWATKEDVRDATEVRDWSGLEFVELRPESDTLLRAYYLDYPLLFRNVDPLPGLLGGRDPYPYLEKVGGLPENGAMEHFFLRGNAPYVDLMVDDISVRLDFNGPGGLGRAVAGRTIKPAGEEIPSFEVYQAKRYVFTR